MFIHFIFKVICIVINENHNIMDYDCKHCIPMSKFISSSQQPSISKTFVVFISSPSSTGLTEPINF